MIELFDVQYVRDIAVYRTFTISKADLLTYYHK